MNVGSIRNIRLVELFDLYWDTKIGAIASKISMAKHAKTEVSNFLRKLAMVMFKKNNRYLPTSLIGPMVYEEYYSGDSIQMDHLQGLFTTILDEDIILEVLQPESHNHSFPLQNYEEEAFLTFVYEEFIEYVIASSLERQLRNLTDLELMVEVERRFDREKGFINIFGIMLFLADLIKRYRGMSVWAQLYEKGDEWRSVLLDAIIKCPEELIDHESVDLLKEISSKICDLHFGEYSDIGAKASMILRTLGHRKFYKFGNETAKIVEMFLSFPDVHVQEEALELLGEVNTEEASMVLLEHFEDLCDFNLDLKLLPLRLVIKAKNRRVKEAFLEILPHVADRDITSFFEKNEAFVRKNLRLTKKQHKKLIESLKIWRAWVHLAQPTFAVQRWELLCEGL